MIIVDLHVMAVHEIVNSNLVTVNAHAGRDFTISKLQHPL